MLGFLGQVRLNSVGGSTDTRVHPVEVGPDIVIFRDGFEAGDASGRDIAVGDWSVTDSSPWSSASHLGGG